MLIGCESSLSSHQVPGSGVGLDANATNVKNNFIYVSPQKGGLSEQFNK